jgi:hypothetical protein
MQRLYSTLSIVWGVFDTGLHDVLETGSVFVIRCKAWMDTRAQFSRTLLHLMKTDPVPETLFLTNIPGTLDSVQSKSSFNESAIASDL